MSTEITMDPVQQMAIIGKYEDLRHEAKRLGLELSIYDTSSVVFKYEGKYMTCYSLQEADMLIKGVEIGVLIQSIKSYNEASKEKNTKVIQPKETP